MNGGYRGRLPEGKSLEVHEGPDSNANRADEDESSGKEAYSCAGNGGRPDSQQRVAIGRATTRVESWKHSAASGQQGRGRGAPLWVGKSTVNSDCACAPARVIEGRPPRTAIGLQQRM